MKQEKLLLTDKEVAKIFSMSASWVRQERYKRRNGQEHTLTIDPVMIGKSPRYRTVDVKKWYDSLS